MIKKILIIIATVILILIITVVGLFIYNSKFESKYQNVNDWLIENNKVFYYETIIGCSVSGDCSGKTDRYLLEEANPTSFKKLNNIYAKDDKNVYMKFSKIYGADASSFEIIEDRYAKDKNRVYTMEPSWQSFELLGKLLFKDLAVIEGADPNSFEVLSYSYAKDKNKVYYFSKTIEEANPYSFITFEIKTNENDVRYDAEDKDNLFFYGKQVENKN